MNLDVKVTGDDKVRAMLLRIGERAAGQALNETVVETEDYIEGQAGKHTKTGALVQSIYTQRLRALAWEIGHNTQQAPEALFVHWGTRPHTIRPKAKKALRWPAGGAFAFAKVVHHPGYAGDPWLARAAVMAPRIFEQHVERVLRTLQD